jgi:hypothetical protein
MHLAYLCISALRLGHVSHTSLTQARISVPSFYMIMDDMHNLCAGLKAKVTPS